MIMRFWGVRGSVPWATPASIGHGCNTPCIEVQDPRTNDVLVLDAGSGIVGLSQTLGSEPRALPILLTHYHWDHTQGLPFVDAFFKAGWHPAIWAPRLRNIDEAAVETIFESPYFPIPYEGLPSRPPIRLADPGEMTVGAFRIRAMMLHHPGGAFAFRIAGDQGDLVYATDHEFGSARHDAELAEFSRGARAVIMDAHFTPAELETHKGWGHGSWRQCVEFAAAHDVGRLWLFHHKPGRADVEVNQIENDARRIFPNTSAAREGDFFEF